MKKLFMVLALIMVCGFIANADAITFKPGIDGNALNSLNHTRYFTWGIDWTPVPEDEIISAKFVFTDLYNNDNESNQLYVHLLESADPGVTSKYDGQLGGDNFAGQGIELFTLFNVPMSPAMTYSYTLTDSELATFVSYVSDGNFGFGIDPDCHFYNAGVKFQVTALPEPGTIMMLGMGLCGVAYYARRKRS